MTIYDIPRLREFVANDSLHGEIKFRDGALVYLDGEIIASLRHNAGGWRAESWDSDDLALVTCLKSTRLGATLALFRGYLNLIDRGLDSRQIEANRLDQDCPGVTV